MKAVLLVSHGSRAEETQREILKLVETLKRKSDGVICHYAFLDVSEPTLEQGVQSCVAEGAEEILILLNFLNAGNHVLKDIPEKIETIKKEYPEISFSFSPHLAEHPAYASFFLDQIQNFKVS